MRTFNWQGFSSPVSRVDNFFGGMRGKFDRENPSSTFISIVYRLRVSARHSGWDHFGGPAWELPDYPGFYSERKAIIKANLYPGDYQITVNFRHFGSPISESEYQDSVFYDKDPLQDVIFFYRPYLINPEDPRQIFRLWDNTLGSPSPEGFKVQDPEVVGERPYLSQ